MTRYNTLLLDRDAWDLVIDSAGNIGMASPGYSLSQDVASAARLFLGELWYNQENGIPYFEEILGKLPPPTLIMSYLEGAALSVPGVVSATVVITSFTDRKVEGQIQFTDETGEINDIQF